MIFSLQQEQPIKQVNFLRQDIMWQRHDVKPTA